jgi:L-alanine-DL-glutamate epimerase-like enolase superfamily enzyme
VKLETTVVRAALRAPLVAAHGETRERTLVLVRIGDGWGEAAPLDSYDGVSIDDVLAAIEDCREPLAGWDGDPATREQALAACARRAVLPQAVAAVDLALWDHTARHAGEPVWRLLGAEAPPAVEVNATIARTDRAGAAAEAAAARELGFGTVKLKVGIGDDAGRVAAVRAAVGPQTAIRLDANGVWSVPEAVAALRALEPAGIELCEEPVHGLADLRAVAAASGIPVALDESAALPGALDQLHADAVCLKISRCGGITGLLASGARARAAGYHLYLASTLDGPLGIAAALHAAAALPGGMADRPCGLATLPLFDASDPLPARAGRMFAPPDPGLGGAAVRAWYQRSAVHER